MSFENFGLKDELLRAVAAEGYTSPTPVQAEAIPVILQKRDVLAGAQTGTGKTAAFALPILQLLGNTKGKSCKPRCLVLTPTRELAAQIQETFESLGRSLSLRSTVIFGGVGINPQIDRLRRGVDILVATPGRLLDHAGRKTLDLSRLEILVLDEADRMLDMGFIHDIRKVLKLLPKRRQNMLFSATYSSDIKRLADKLLNDPELIEVSPANKAADGVTQAVYPVARTRKRELLSKLIRTGDWNRVLVFTRTKHGANRLTKQLIKDGIKAAAIHGNKSQTARTRALADFKNGKIRALVATDIAARGLDIDMLPHVVNFDLPNVPEDYVHRIGRTGRAGAQGIAISLVCGEEQKQLRDIQRLLNQKIPVKTMDGFDQERTVSTQPNTFRKKRPNSRPRYAQAQAHR
ncbi:MAG: DEAD/DEAH box helicase [Desulfobacteraceae bacterium]|nr:DEAD/DEAH box helicase [Desulfobacteraceae bacterium]